MQNNRKREIRIPDIDKYNAKFGTLNKYRPEVIYIIAKTKVSPKTRKADYSQDVSNIKTNFLKAVDGMITNDSRLRKEHICNIDANDSGMTYGKNSYIKYDIYIKPTELKAIDDYYQDMHQFICRLNNVLSDLIEKNSMMHI